jgi:cystathionine gamma-synthase
LKEWLFCGIFPMTTLRYYSLGQTCPNSPHAVVSSLPTMADVRGYEEGDPRVMAALRSGYPRFRVHAFIQELTAFYLERVGLADRGGFLIPGRRSVQDLVDWIGPGVTAIEVEPGLYLLHHPLDQFDLQVRVRRTIQHIGCAISSRQAEDLLCAHGLRLEPHVEAVEAFGAETAVESELAEQIGCRRGDVLLCASGMNAFYAGFRAIEEAQAARGRRKWLQVGWLYLDSGCILQKFLGPGASLDCCYDATDTDALIEKIEAAADALACVVIECPTNPLVQVADLRRIHEAVRRVGGMLLVDPSIASVYNVNVLQYADILVTSLTKYAAHEGDVMIGALALNPESPHYGDLVLRTSSFHQPPYRRDLARLAAQLKKAPPLVARLNENAAELAGYLREHPAVRRVCFAGHAEDPSQLARGHGTWGAVISIELVGDMEPFYNALKVMKGPSFGTDFTLACPFMYLAHYELVTSARGRQFLQSVGIYPELIRISVGTEPIASIIEVFDQAFQEQ